MCTRYSKRPPNRVSGRHYYHGGVIASRTTVTNTSITLKGDDAYCACTVLLIANSGASATTDTCMNETYLGWVPLPIQAKAANEMCQHTKSQSWSQTVSDAGKKLNVLLTTVSFRPITTQNVTSHRRIPRLLPDITCHLVNRIRLRICRTWRHRQTASAVTPCLNFEPHPHPEKVYEPSLWPFNMSEQDRHLITRCLGLFTLSSAANPPCNMICLPRFFFTAGRKNEQRNNPST